MELVHRVLEIEVPGHPLAHQATLHVGEAYQDGVDLLRLDCIAQGVDIEVGRHRWLLLVG